MMMMVMLMLLEVVNGIPRTLFQALSKLVFVCAYIQPSAKEPPENQPSPVYPHHRHEIPITNHCHRNSNIPTPQLLKGLWSSLSAGSMEQ